MCKMNRAKPNEINWCNKINGQSVDGNIASLQIDSFFNENHSPIVVCDRSNVFNAEQASVSSSFIILSVCSFTLSVAARNAIVVFQTTENVKKWCK